MKKKLIWVAISFFSLNVYADYKDDIGFTQLQTDLGAAIPSGNGIAVTQVEAATGASSSNSGAWMPDINSNQFNTKIITDHSSPLSNGFSAHATSVGNLFYGNTSSMASGIVDVDVYSAADWLINGFLKTGSNSQPLVSNTRIANHSWVGNITPSPNSSIDPNLQVLQRVDWLVEENEFIQVTAMNNGTTNKPLLGSSFNSIAVGRTDGNHAQGSVVLDSTYTSGRTRPDVVTPMTTTSGAAPIVSAAVAMLIEQAQSAAQGTSSVISNGDNIYNGERSEVIKAVIMAGADRVTNNSSTTAQISNYKSSLSNQTANGLDQRYGAGQLNVFNNYQIMAAGEQDSIQDGGAVTVGMEGYDYDESFGGAQGSNNNAIYSFDTIQVEGLQLTASLVWNIDIEDTVNGAGFSTDAILHNMDLFLYDVTDSSSILLASSVSDIDNSENLWYFLESGHEYQIQVSAANGSAFNWDYGLAWQISAVPVPGAAWLFMSGILGMLSVVRTRRVL